MRHYRTNLIFLCFTFMLLAATTIAVAQEPPANVAGNWTIHSKGPDGRDRTQVMQITQHGGAIYGHYQGPGQQGELEGTINEQHIPLPYQDSNCADVQGSRGRTSRRRHGPGQEDKWTYRDEHGMQRNAAHSE
jgi:hypothetical protein